MEWNREYEMGHPLLDAEHRTLFEALSMLSRGYCDDDLIDTQIKILKHYVTVHFAQEERLMAKAAYPNLEEHRGLHTEFRATVSHLHARWRENGASGIREEIIGELSGWLKQHIVEADHAYLPWVIKLGPPSIG